MILSKGIYATLFLALAQLSLAAGVPHVNRRHDSAPSVTLRTNAARMAAGLTPLAPRNLEGRTFGHGGPPSKPKPSSTPPGPGKPDCDDKKQVRIKCSKKGGGFVGYVGKDFSSKDRNKRGFGLSTSRDQALSVDFENSVTPFDVKIPSRSDFPFLGWAGNNLGSSNTAVLTGTKKTEIDKTPSNVGNAFSSFSASSESQVWYYTRNTRKFDAKWVNAGGARVESRTFYNPDDDLFHLVTDTYQFIRRSPRAYEVELELDE